MAPRPTLVTLGIGINDIGQACPLKDLRATTKRSSSGSRRKTGAPIVVTNMPDMSFAPVVPLFMRSELDRRIMLFNESSKRLPSVTSCRRRRLLGDARGDPSHPEFFSEDGFHPSDEGYEYWAEMMWPTVKSAIGE